MCGHLPNLEDITIVDCKYCGMPPIVDTIVVNNQDTIGIHCHNPYCKSLIYTLDSNPNVVATRWSELP